MRELEKEHIQQTTRQTAISIFILIWLYLCIVILHKKWGTKKFNLARKQNMCYNRIRSGANGAFALVYGWIPEWPKGADCKSVGNAFEGSNPSPSIGIEH